MYVQSKKHANTHKRNRNLLYHVFLTHVCLTVSEIWKHPVCWASHAVVMGLLLCFWRRRYRVSFSATALVGLCEDGVPLITDYLRRHLTVLYLIRSRKSSRSSRSSIRCRTASTAPLPSSQVQYDALPGGGPAGVAVVPWSRSAKLTYVGPG